MNQSVIFDMDGTLCDVQAIRHYVRGPKVNFDAFHKASLWCPPNQDVLDMARGHVQLGHRIIVVTARDEKHRDVTSDWLAKYPIPHDELLMRPWGDQRKDREVKIDILNDIRARGHSPYMAYDDNPHVIDMWKEYGLSVHVVPGWDATPLEESLGALTPEHV